MALRGGGRGPRARDEAKPGDRTLLNAVRTPPTPGAMHRRPGPPPMAPAGCNDGLSSRRSRGLT